ncbi:MAG: hypothetical protein AAGD07_04120 [Planctomycetota bacterium]
MQPSIHKRALTYTTVVIVGVILGGTGCAIIPEARVRDSIHNPFPQLKRVAIVPFFNQSDSPHVDGDAVAKAYYAALQSIPGFEVLPVGVTAIQFRQYASENGVPQTGADFQRLAQAMDVEAVVIGSITDFDSYYPPRMAMTVHWYAANEGYHVIPPGYGLPWGTKAEKDIPARILRETEFELARAQLKTQTPSTGDPLPPSPEEIPTNPGEMVPSDLDEKQSDFDVARVAHQRRQQENETYQAAVADHRIAVPGIVEIDGFSQRASPNQASGPAAVSPLPWETVPVDSVAMVDGDMGFQPFMDELPVAAAPLPPSWPNPADLIPDPPAPVPPIAKPNHEPVLAHTRLYRGDDPYFTGRLADYVETADDARGSSWQGYIKRSDDFVRFCCHLHVTEMLESRGGSDPRDLILRWPLSRY